MILSAGTVSNHLPGLNRAGLPSILSSSQGTLTTRWPGTVTDGRASPSARNVSRSGAMSLQNDRGGMCVLLFVNDFAFYRAVFIVFFILWRFGVLGWLFGFGGFVHFGADWHNTVV